MSRGRIGLPRPGRGAGIALRAGVTLACLWLAWSLAPGAGDLPDLDEAKPAWLIPAVVAYGISLTFLCLRLHLLAGAMQGGGAGVGPVPAPRAILRLTWASLGAAQVGLGIAGADPVRVWALVRQGWRAEAALRLVIVDRVAGLAGLVVLGCLALTGLRAGSGAGSGAVLILALVLALVLAGLAWAALRGMGRLRHAMPSARRLGQLVQGFAVLGSRATLAALVLALAGHAMSVVIFYAVARAAGMAPPLAETALAVPVGLLLAFLPVSLGGWGVREAAIVQAYAMLARPFEGAFGASLLFGVFITGMCVPGFLALPGLVRGRDRGDAGAILRDDTPGRQGRRDESD